jgi:hypothetical protein
MYQIDTIGMEFETCARLSNDFYKDDGIASYFKSTHDASIETPIVILRNNIYMVDNGKLPPLFRHFEKATAGIELVSNPLTFDNMEKAVEILTKRLSRFGARDEEERAGIHIHCAYPISVKVLVETIRLSLAFESLIFHLGGMGYKFRGSSNNSIFCRPLSSFGPPIVNNRNGDKIQLLDISSVLQAKDMATFWKLFGGIDVNHPPSRYHPSRYFFVNPFSSLLHSTLEFRVFNASLNIDYILACMRFCQEFTLMCVSGKNPFDFVSSVYKPSMTSEELLDTFCAYTKMEPEWKKVLFEIIKKTPFPILEEKYILTHLRDYQTVEEIWNAKKFSGSEYEQSGFIDIHNIGSGQENRRARREIPQSALPRGLRINHETGNVEQIPENEIMQDVSPQEQRIVSDNIPLPRVAQWANENIYTTGTTTSANNNGPLVYFTANPTFQINGADTIQEPTIPVMSEDLRLAMERLNTDREVRRQERIRREQEIQLQNRINRIQELNDILGLQGMDQLPSTLNESEIEEIEYENDINQEREEDNINDTEEENDPAEGTYSVHIP